MTSPIYPAAPIKKQLPLGNLEGLSRGLFGLEFMITAPLLFLGLLWLIYGVGHPDMNAAHALATAAALLVFIVGTFVSAVNFLNKGRLALVKKWDKRHLDMSVIGFIGMSVGFLTLPGDMGIVFVVPTATLFSHLWFERKHSRQLLREREAATLTALEGEHQNPSTPELMSLSADHPPTATPLEAAVPPKEEVVSLGNLEYFSRLLFGIELTLTAPILLFVFITLSSLLKSGVGADYLPHPLALLATCAALLAFVGGTFVPATEFTKNGRRALAKTWDKRHLTMSALALVGLWVGLLMDPEGSLLIVVIPCTIYFMHLLFERTYSRRLLKEQEEEEELSITADTAEKK